MAGAGDPDPIGLPGDRGEVADAEDELPLASSPAQPGDDALPPVGAVDPLEALLREIQLVQGRTVAAGLLYTQLLALGIPSLTTHAAPAIPLVGGLILACQRPRTTSAQRA